MKINGTDITTTYPGIRVLSVDNPFPETKIDFLDIKGRNGKLKTSVGDTVYNNKTIQITLGIRKLSNLKKFFQDLANDLLGNNVKLTPDSYDGWSFDSYITSFTDYELSLTLGKVVLNFDAFPFAIKDTDTVVTTTVTDSTNITLSNSRMIVMPKVSCTSDFTITQGTSTWSVSTNTSGVFLEGFKLYKGDTTITATGAGDITFTYREGRF